MLGMGLSAHVISKAGFASDGVEWTNLLATAFCGGVSYDDEQTLSR